MKKSKKILIILAPLVIIIIGSLTITLLYIFVFDESTKCLTNSDCTLVQGDCCITKLIPLNITSAEEWKKTFTESNNCSNYFCAESMGGHGSFYSKPACQLLHCTTKIDKEKICDSTILKNCQMYSDTAQKKYGDNNDVNCKKLIRMCK